MRRFPAERCYVISATSRRKQINRGQFAKCSLRNGVNVADFIENGTAQDVRFIPVSVVGKEDWEMHAELDWNEDLHILKGKGQVLASHFC